MAKSRTVTGAGVIATAALVVIFGNQAVSEWVSRHTNPNGVWGWFLRILTWPSWAIGPDDNSSGAMRKLFAQDLRAILLIAFVAAILGMVAKTVSGGAAGFLLGWSALIFGSALAAFLTAFIVSNPTFIGALNAAAVASAYGLFVGWIVGAATATAKGAG
ncbi:MAG: hypothetical protein ACM30G_00470 [Micromonosporaceae bacterium]